MSPKNCPWKPPQGLICPISQSNTLVRHTYACIHARRVCLHATHGSPAPSWPMSMSVSMPTGTCACTCVCLYHCADIYVVLEPLHAIQVLPFRKDFVSPHFQWALGGRGTSKKSSYARPSRRPWGWGTRPPSAAWSPTPRADGKGGRTNSSANWSPCPQVPTGSAD